MDDLSTQGAVLTGRASSTTRPTATSSRQRRLEDERYALFAEASIVWLDLPDAVYRGYDGDASCSASRATTTTRCTRSLRREIDRLEPQKVYLPLGVGNHVDHQLCRDVGIRLLAESRKWVMPGPEYAGIVTFYEDFPYAWWHDFSSLGDLPADAAPRRPGRHRADRPTTPRSPTRSSARSTASRSTRASSSGCSAGPTRWPARSGPMPAKVALLGGIGSSAERYWSTKAT